MIILNHWFNSDCVHTLEAESPIAAQPECLNGPNLMQNA